MREKIRKLYISDEFKIDLITDKTLGGKNVKIIHIFLREEKYYSCV
jgi:hypothetical protein